MPVSNVANQATYDIGAPAVADAVLAWRVRNFRGGKVRIKVERTPNTPDPAADASVLTFSFQVAPKLATGLPGTFIATTSANNLAAITNEVVTQQGTHKAYEILLRPGVDCFLLMKAAGGCRAQVIIDSDTPMDLWRTTAGLPAVTEV